MARIVVIEDEPDLREIIVEELEDLGHKIVGSAADGEAGLRTILNTKPEIVLADINMPKLNGYQLKQKLNEGGGRAAELPFVFVSAYSERSDIADGLILGADHYITKPIDFDALDGWIRELTEA